MIILHQQCAAVIEMRYEQLLHKELDCIFREAGSDLSDAVEGKSAD